MDPLPKQRTLRGWESVFSPVNRLLSERTGLKHDPEKCVAVFRKDHAQSKTQSAMTIQPNLIALGCSDSEVRRLSWQTPDANFGIKFADYSLISLRARALATAEVRLTAFSFREASTRWNFTVRSEILRMTETSQDVFPPATQRSTSRSRAVSTPRVCRSGRASDRMRLWA